MEEQWLTVCAVENLSDGNREIIEIEELRILVTRVDQEYFAVESLCTHAMFELDDAQIEGCEIICPLHAAHFCLRSGKVLTPPAFEDLRTFPVRINEGLVEVRVA